MNKQKTLRAICVAEPRCLPMGEREEDRTEERNETRTEKSERCTENRKSLANGGTEENHTTSTLRVGKYKKHAITKQKQRQHKKPQKQRPRKYSLEIAAAHLLW